MQPSEYKTILTRIFADACATLSPSPREILLQIPRDRQHGDYACAAALTLAPLLKRPPAAIAAEILAHIQLPDFVESATIVGGYINIKIKTAAKLAIIGEILHRDKDFGRRTNHHETILLEFVSANPTGPLHIGHGRAAAFGDSLANILKFVGAEVWREYYVNDAGRQTDILAASVWLRYFLPPATDMPDGSYRGEYLCAVLPAVQSFLQDLPPPSITTLFAQMKNHSADQAGDVLIAALHEGFVDVAARTAFVCAVSAAVLDMIKKDLTALAVAEFDAWFSERSLYTDEQLSAVIEQLRRRDADSIYEQDGALWFRAGARGDDKDRVLRRANGNYTYFTADIAYHHHKMSRPLAAGRQRRLINILGADHHGYVPRLRAAIDALGHDSQLLETQLIQFVALVNGGQRIKMSTRGGEFVPLSELIEKTDSDAARFFYVCRKNDQHLDFDIKLATAKNRQNPVYYLKYAHARAAAVFRRWAGDKQTLHNVDCASLSDNPAAMALCAILAAFPDAVATAAKERAVHLLAAFLQDLAAALHEYYESARIIGNDSGMLARLALLSAAQTTIAIGLGLLGIGAPERMDKNGKDND